MYMKFYIWSLIINYLYKVWAFYEIINRAAPIPKFPPIPRPILRYSPIPIPILPIPEIADTFADADTDTDTFKNNVLKNV